MPLTIQLLRSRMVGPLNTVRYADLSDIRLARIENLHVCPKLQSLVLRGNDITILQNLTLCHHLWHLDLGNNQVTNLDGLSKFVALGTLNLSHNNLTWNDLRNIRHMYILDLSLHGNPKLDKDPYYRIHVIDCLPNVWMLDGRLVTSAERIQVQHFFQDSALTEHPVRHKLSREQFIPTSLKKIEVHGVHGSRTAHLLMRFPTNGALNVDTDHRRLVYLAYNLQEDIQLELQQMKRSLTRKEFMERLLEARSRDGEKCNVLLLLLVASVEFTLPYPLLQDTLTITKLREILEDFDCLELFLMSEAHRCRVLSIFLSAVKLDRDDHKTGGLYDKLYLCLYYTVAELVKKCNGKSAKYAVPSVHRTNPIYREYRSLMAAEVVQLLCIVPMFYDYITKESTIMQLVTLATGNASVIDGITGLMERIHKRGGGTRRIIEEVSAYLVESIQRNTEKVIRRKISSKSPSNYVLETPRALPKRPQSSPVYASKFMAVGRPSPIGKPISRPIRGRPSSQASRPGTACSTRSSASEHLSPSSSPYSPSLLPPAAALASLPTYKSPRQQETWVPAKPPKLGDKVLLGPQNLAYIIAMPEYDVALLQMETIPDLSKSWKALNGSVVSFSRNVDEHFVYMNMVHMKWDQHFRYWKPKGSIGDRITLQNSADWYETNPPPSSPTSSTSPRSTGDSEKTHHPSPRESMENLPQPISMRLLEKLQLSPKKILPTREETQEEENDDNPNLEQMEEELDHLRDNNQDHHRDEVLNGKHVIKLRDLVTVSETENSAQQERTVTALLSARTTEEKVESRVAEPESSNADDSLYNCLRCAMETIKINNEVLSPPNTPTGSVVASVSRQTERAVNSAMVNEVAAANTMSTEHINASLNETRDQSRQVGNRPHMARSGPETGRSQAEVNVLELNIWPDSGLYNEYQRERTSAWEKSVQRPKSSTSVRRVARSNSRASSAKSRVGTPQHYPHQQRDSQGSTLLIQMGNHWLAGGRDIATWERVTNRMKTYHTPGWIEGSSASRRPKSVGLYRLKQRNPTQHRAKSAVGQREKAFFYQDDRSSHPPPSPASTDFTSAGLALDPEPDYLHQAHQYNFTSTNRPLSATRPMAPSSVKPPTTPPYGAPRKPSSPLNMTIK